MSAISLTSIRTVLAKIAHRGAGFEHIDEAHAKVTNEGVRLYLAHHCNGEAISAETSLTWTELERSSIGDPLLGITATALAHQIRASAQERLAERREHGDG